MRMRAATAETGPPTSAQQPSGLTARRPQRHAQRRRRRPRRRLRQAGRQQQRAVVLVECVQDAERRGLLRVLLRVAACIRHRADCSTPAERRCDC